MDFQSILNYFGIRLSHRRHEREDCSDNQGAVVRSLIPIQASQAGILVAVDLQYRFPLNNPLRPLLSSFDRKKLS